MNFLYLCIVNQKMKIGAPGMSKILSSAQEKFS